MFDIEGDIITKGTVSDRLRRLEILAAEANTVRQKDEEIIRSLFENFYSKRLNVGLGFQRAYGSILSGDYFDLIKLPDENYLFIFADISGHGLPAYTTLIRLRSAITIGINQMWDFYKKKGQLDTDNLVRDICTKFTDIMDKSNSFDFACVNFVFVYNDRDKFHLKFYNRSMLFPIVMRKFENQLVDIYNLNEEEKGWYPNKGYLLGSDVRKLLGNEAYLETPHCDFTLYEGDYILFYSDGIIEAYNFEDPLEEYGHERLEKLMLDNINQPPQTIINTLFNSIYDFIGTPEQKKDDMTAVLIHFPLVRD